MDDLTDTVLAAQRGDADAFQLLVRRFQDLAFGAAFARVGDPQLAQDVAQEAFLQAHRDLHTLREPRAFGFWLRRIVAKHADRMRRGKRVTTVPLDAALLARDHAHGPAELAESRELADLVRAEITRLPAHERVVVALYYVADQPQSEIAAFLQVPPSTIKKRLHDARRRLKERMMSQLGDHLREHRPSQDERFARRVQFLVAVRTGDRATAERQLAADPSLVGATLDGEDWGRAEMDRPTLPLESNFTPLDFAVMYGQLELAASLLDRGADANLALRNETPLARAVVMRERAIVELLLRRGADPNLRSLRQLTPLHRAAMRGFPDLAELLLTHGADASLRDANDRTALDWAVLNGRAEVAALLGARTTDVRAEAPPAGGPILQTGIKVLDVLAPLPLGGAIHTSAQGGVGKMVLLAEVVQRLARRGGRAVFVRWEERFYRAAEADREQRETGIDLISTVVLGSMAERGRAIDEGLATAERLRDSDGGRDVLLLIDAPPTGDLPLADVFSRIGVRGGGSITLLVFDLLLPNTHYAAAALAPATWDVHLTFDRGLAKRGIYPAVDVLGSSSALLSDGRVGEEHARVAARVRTVLGDRSAADRAEALRQFQAQPFFVAEPWTARPGSLVPLAEAIAGYAGLLDRAQ